MITDRSLVVVQDGIRLASPLAIVVATVLFFAGHNQPGGGFAGGLVLGAVMALRTATGLSVPRHPVRLMSLGGVIIGVVAIAPLVVGDVVLDQYVWETTLPILGKVKAGTALIFDVGVVLVVVGLILAMLDALGAGDSELNRPGTARVRHRVTGGRRVGRGDAMSGVLVLSSSAPSRRSAPTSSPREP